jgi:hypothetical protein
MPQIQFGWTMPSIPPDAMPGDSYVTNVQRGLELIAGVTFRFCLHLVLPCFSDLSCTARPPFEWHS